MFIFVPKEYFEFGLFDEISAYVEDKLGFVFTHLKSHLGQHVGIRNLSIPDDFHFFRSRGEWQCGCPFLLDVQLGKDILLPKDVIPTFLGFLGLDNRVYELISKFLPKGKFTG